MVSANSSTESLSTWKWGWGRRGVLINRVLSLIREIEPISKNMYYACAGARARATFKASEASFGSCLHDVYMVSTFVYICLLLSTTKASLVSW